MSEQIEDLLDALAEDAAQQDLMSEEGRERARDADDSIGMIDEPSEQAQEELAAAAQATVPVAEATGLDGNGAAPSTNTEEIQDIGGKRKAGGGVAMARTIVMATVTAATTRAWLRE